VVSFQESGAINCKESLTMRINRALSRAGVCSRREADRLIEQGRVLVDGNLAMKGVVIPLSAKVRELAFVSFFGITMKQTGHAGTRGQCEPS
jgi:hypothetical protein